MRNPLLWLLAASGCLKLLYVLWLTDYPQYLFSDFGGYWDRAHQRLDGDEFGLNQWAIWPPLPHVLLAAYLEATGFLGLWKWRLEAVLAANVLLSTGAVALVYGIARETLRRSGWALAIAALYAFTYPLAYLNAFVMSEHPAVFCMLGATWLALRYRRNAWALAAAGALLGLAVGLRPAFGLFGLPFAAYIAAADWFDRRAIARAALFSLGFFALVAGAVLETYRVSRGEVLGLGANGGVSFYFSQCGTYEVIARHRGFEYRLVTPSVVERPEAGSVVLDRPMHDQAFFFRLGWECMRDQKDFLGAALSRLRALFFGPLLPSIRSARGFDQLMTPFRWMFAACALTLPLAFFLRRDLGVRLDGLALLGGVLGAAAVTLYVLNVEHRFLYPLIGPLYLVAGAVALALASDLRRLAKPLVAWAGVIAAVALAVQAGGLTAPTLISATVRDFPSPWNKSPRDVVAPREAFRTDALRLRQAEGFFDHVSVAFATCMEVREAGLYELQVVSDEPVGLMLGGEVLLSSSQARDAGVFRVRRVLQAGKLPYYLHYYHAHGPAGVVATWRRVTAPNADYRPAFGLHYIGESGAEISFSPPEDCLRLSPRQ